MIQVPKNLYCLVEFGSGRLVYVAGSSYAEAEEKYMDKMGIEGNPPTKISLSAKSTEFIP
jgi:hypothetical protein